MIITHINREKKYKNIMNLKNIILKKIVNIQINKQNIIINIYGGGGARREREEKHNV